MLSLKLVAIAKDEAPYLAEWIFHHLYPVSYTHLTLPTKA